MWPGCSGYSDIVFLVDSSGSIRHERFPQVLDFIVNIVTNLDVASDRTRIGLLYWSSSASVGFYLNQYYKKQDVIQVSNFFSVTCLEVLKQRSPV